MYIAKKHQYNAEAIRLADEKTCMSLIYKHIDDIMKNKVKGLDNFELDFINFEGKYLHSTILELISILREHDYHDIHELETRWLEYIHQVKEEIHNIPKIRDVERKRKLKTLKALQKRYENLLYYSYRKRKAIKNNRDRSSYTFKAISVPNYNKSRSICTKGYNTNRHTPNSKGKEVSWWDKCRKFIREVGETVRTLFGELESTFYTYKGFFLEILNLFKSSFSFV